MEGDQSNNNNNTAFVAGEGKPTPSNEPPAKAPPTEFDGETEPPYIPLDVWVKEVKYSDESYREYTEMWISEEDHHSP